MLHIVLHEPEIPFNTGAIARTCVATGTSLHMIKPYGFVINDKMIRRAGMDYWPKVELHEYVDFDDFLQRTHLFTSENRIDASKSQTLVEMDKQRTNLLIIEGGRDAGKSQTMVGTDKQRTHLPISESRKADDRKHASSNSNRQAAQSPTSTGSATPRKAQAAPSHLWFATTKAHQVYSDVHFGSNDYIMFGKESAGIPEQILVDHEESCIRIPMWGDIRSLNLSNSVAIILYEALRQNNFFGLSPYGELHHLHWKQETK